MLIMEMENDAPDLRIEPLSLKWDRTKFEGSFAMMNRRSM
jgi:hypothetical protein